MKKINLAACLIIFIFIISCQSQMIENQSKIKDFRDNNIYRIVKIGNQIWMAQNLKYKSKKSWCYKNKKNNCKKNGRLYNWHSAKKACPKGWHLPSEKEWAILINNFDKDLTPLLKNGKAGFNILLSGYRKSNGRYKYLGIHFFFWTSTKYSKDKRKAISHWNLFRNKLSKDKASKKYGYSVRCVRN